MDNLTIKKLRLLVESDKWDAIEPFVDKIVEKWNKVEVKRESEFETLWELAKREGKIEGVREFISSIEEIASNVN